MNKIDKYVNKTSKFEKRY